MSLIQSQTAIEIMNRIEGVRLHEKKGGKFKYFMYMTSAMRNTSIEVLELSMRSYNVLMRAGLITIGQVVDSIASGSELRSIRNCGVKSVTEIQEQLFIYQYFSLPQEKREDYLLEVVLMNQK